MTFSAPARLLALAGVAALVAGYLVMQARRRRYAVRFTRIELLDRVAPRGPGWRRHLPPALFAVALATLVVGFAEPSIARRTPRERATIILAIDTSRSMQATDVEPSRFEAAKEAARAFVDIIPPKINIGVVGFDGSATVKVAPTTNHDEIQKGIRGLRMGDSTATGEAVFASLDAIDTIPPDAVGTPPPARIVLLSDGFRNTGRTNDMAAQAALDAEVPVSTIAFGTDEDALVFVPNEPGRAMPAPPDRDALRALADATGGTAFEAASGDELRAVYEDIGSSVGYTTQDQDISAWLIGLALVLLAAGGAASLAWFGRLP